MEGDGKNTFELNNIFFFCEFDKYSITRSIVVSCVNKNGIELYTIGKHKIILNLKLPQFRQPNGKHVYAIGLINDDVCY